MFNVLGGAEIAAYDIAQELSKKHEVECLTHAYDARLFPSLKMHVVKTKGKLLSNMRRGLEFKKNFPLGDYDVLLIHTPAPGFLISRVETSKTVWYIPEPVRYAYMKQMGDPYQPLPPSSIMRGWLIRQLDRLLLRHVDSLVCYSRYMADVIRRTFKKQPHVVPLGINLQRFPRLPLKQTLNFAYLGRIALLKNLHGVVKALSLCVKRFPNATLTIRGSGSKNDENGLRALVSALGLRENVIMEAASREVLSTYSDAQAIVYVTFNEPFGLVPVEGMATCRPVIVSNQGGMVDTVIDGETGFLVDPFDTKIIADRMVTLLEDFNRCREMGLSGRRRVEENFTIQKTTGQLEAILKG